MRSVLFAVVVFMLLTGRVLAQTAPDIANVPIGKPNPIKLLVAPAKRESSLPFYSITVPMPEESLFKVFFEYHVDAFYDSGNIYALRARRTLGSLRACEGSLKSLVAPLTNAYRLGSSKSEQSMFEAEGGDISVRISCEYTEGSPFPALDLYIYSKAGAQKVDEQMRKIRGR